MDWRSLLSHTSQSRLPPSPNNVLKKSKVVSDFYFFLHPCGLGRGNQEFWGEVISGTLGRTKAPRASPQRELPSGRSAVSVPHHILKHCGKKTKTTKEVTEIKAIHQNVKNLSHAAKLEAKLVLSLVLPEHLLRKLIWSKLLSYKELCFDGVFVWFLPWLGSLPLGGRLPGCQRSIWGKHPVPCFLSHMGGAKRVISCRCWIILKTGSARNKMAGVQTSAR